MICFYRLVANISFQTIMRFRKVSQESVQEWVRSGDGLDLQGFKSSFVK